MAAKAWAFDPPEEKRASAPYHSEKQYHGQSRPVKEIVDSLIDARTSSLDPAFVAVRKRRVI
jgi:hypothetical protein